MTSVEDAVAVLVITDGRTEYLTECVASLQTAAAGNITERWMYDDTGNPAHRAHLAALYPDWVHINGGPRQGFGGAIDTAWRILAAESTARWVFHVEQDFRFERPVPLGLMADVLDDHPYLMQMALCRQPWSPLEHAAGGVVEAHPQAYVQRYSDDGAAWLEQRLFFTTNPSLYRRELCARGWPAGAQSEGRFTHDLLINGALGVPGQRVRFAYWGVRGAHVWVEHIGHQRVGVGY
jgi:hypothetical protein